MLPTIRSFMKAHQLRGVTIVADAGMVSEANREAIEDERLSYVIGARIAEVPYVVAQWRRTHPDGEAAVPADGQVFTAPWPAAGAKRAAGRRDKVTYYQYRTDRVLTAAAIWAATSACTWGRLPERGSHVVLVERGGAFRARASCSMVLAASGGSAAASSRCANSSPLRGRRARATPPHARRSIVAGAARAAGTGRRCRCR